MNLCVLFLDTDFVFKDAISRDSLKIVCAMLVTSEMAANALDVISVGPK